MWYYQSISRPKERKISRFFYFTALLLLSFNGICLASNYTLKWAKICGNAYANFAEYEVDSQGNIFVTGLLTDSIDLDPSAATSFVHASTQPSIKTIFFAKYSKNGNFIWAKTIRKKSFSADPFKIQLDKYDNLYLSGNFGDSTDFDPGAGIGILRTKKPQYEDLFFAKYDNNGNFILAKPIYSNDWNWYNKFYIDKNFDKIFVTGNFEDTASFNPGTTLSNKISVHGSGAFVAKYDLNGTFEWVNFIEGWTAIINDIKTDSNGNILLTGEYDYPIYYCYDSANCITMPATATYTTMGGANVWNGSNSYFAKFNSSGNLQWINYIVCPSPNNAQRLIIDQQNNVLAETFCSSSAVIVSTNGNFSPPLGTYSGPYFLKFDTNGDFLNAKNSYNPSSIDTDRHGNIYLSGILNGSLDFDLTSSSQILNSLMPVPYLAKYDSNFNLMQTKIMGQGNTHGHYYFKDSLGVYFGGTFSGAINPDPSLDSSNSMISVGSDDMIFGLYEKDTCNNLHVRIDSLNSIFCNSIAGSIYSSAHFGIPPYSYSWNTPSSSNTSVGSSSVPGNYTITVYDSIGCSASATARIEKSNYPNDFDLAVNMIGVNFRTGILTPLWLDVYNNGCVPASGILRLIIDPACTFNYATPPPYQQIGDTLFWNVPTINFNNTHFQPVVYLTSNQIIPGGLLSFEADVSPTLGDVNPTNNYRKCHFPTLNAYDPNFKAVYPEGTGPLNKISNNQAMTYTIHFQNTGNASAQTVFIVDSIQATLNFISLRVIGSSHPLSSVSYPSNHVVRFNFNGINLPDSTSDPVGSNGYVIYEIEQQPNLPPLTQISNTASIYFDYNPPIVTNTVQNTIDNTTSTRATENTAIDFMVFPNPVQKSLIIDFRGNLSNLHLLLTNSLGQKFNVPVEYFNNQVQLSVESLPYGLYHLVGFDSKSGINWSKSFVKQ